MFAARGGDCRRKGGRNGSGELVLERVSVVTYDFGEELVLFRWRYLNYVLFTRTKR